MTASGAGYWATAVCGNAPLLTTTYYEEHHIDEEDPTKARHLAPFGCGENRTLLLRPAQVCCQIAETC